MLKIQPKEKLLMSSLAFMYLIAISIVMDFSLAAPAARAGSQKESETDKKLSAEELSLELDAKNLRKALNNNNFEANIEKIAQANREQYAPKPGDDRPLIARRQISAIEEVPQIVKLASSAAQTQQENKTENENKLEDSKLENDKPENNNTPENKVAWSDYRSITAYNSLPNQTDNSPCITANGFNVCEHGIEDTIAANFLKFGTKVKIPDLFGDRIFIVRDRMNQRYPNNLDVWLLSYDEAKKFGRRTARIEVLE